ncbi:MAG: hypothetical protein M1828_006182 [Chrysothrix sp. TS-e1954]|nr:MAG: hypothetical protein M1828_006182 [Chrysothrix sp. TS-e1954]
MTYEMKSRTPLYDRKEQAGLEARQIEDGLHVVPKQPGLEVRPAEAGLLPSRDDRKMLHSEEKAETRPRRRLCGIPVKIFWTLVVLLALVVVAIAIGVGVGVSEKSSSSKSSSSTADNGGCLNGTTYISSTDNITFREYCNTDFVVGTLVGKTTIEAAGTTTVADTIAVNDGGLNNVSTFEACMDACAVDRKQGVTIPNVDGTCLSVTWTGTPTDGTCFMKNATAIIGSGNKTVYKLHASPQAHTGLQSANIIDEEGNPL